MSADPRPLRFSVVIPAYNEGRYLGRTLESLRSQDFVGGHEVIVVDNGSVDDTVAVAQAAGVRVVHEPHPGVCSARQRGTDAALGEIVVSTDADTVHPTGWLTGLDARFQQHPDAVAVAGPCRYEDPPWWAGLVPPLWFSGIGALYAHTGRVGYLTATNVAFVRDGFPGYDTALTQGGDEVDLLRRLRSRGTVVWDADNPVLTSSRRLDQGLAHTLVVSYGYYYALSHVLGRVTERRVIGMAPAIRQTDLARAARTRRRWRIVAGTVVVASALWKTRRPTLRRC